MIPPSQNELRLFGAKWFISPQNHESHGDLSAQILRLVAAGALHLTPCMLAAAFSFKLLPEPWSSGVPTFIFVIWIVLFSLLWRTMLKIFIAYPEKKLDQVYFNLLMVLVVVVGGARTIWNSSNLSDYAMLLNLFSFIVGICATLFMLTAVLAGCRLRFGQIITCILSSALAVHTIWTSLSFLR